MYTSNSRIAELVIKKMNNSLSEAEVLELNQVLSDPAKKKLYDELMDVEQTREQVRIMSEGDKKASWSIINAAYCFSPKKSHGKKYLASAAIMLLLAIVATLYFYKRRSPSIPASIQPVVKSEEAVYIPKSRNAVWSQSGLNLFIDSLQNGVLGNASGMSVLKNDSEIVFSTTQVKGNRWTDTAHTLSSICNQLVNDNNTVFNTGSTTVQTVRGGYYRLQLPDGSKVVLNSASSINFDSTFSHDERVVTVIGEAFLDVRHVSQRPFYVQVPGLQIEIDGGQFNVTAYKDDVLVITSLGKGSANIKTGNLVVNLKGGEQVEFNRKKRFERRIINTTAVETAIDWKEGRFDFHDAPIKNIINELSRWYDLDVQYNGNIPKNKCDGIFHRNQSISSILKDLQRISGVRMTIQHNKIVVGP